MTIFTILNASTPVKAILGSNPLRVFPWGEAPERVTKPYATYGVYNGNPQNTMDTPAEIDIDGTQIDIWAETASSCLNAANAIRAALETYAHCVSTQNDNKDPETKLYHSRLEFDFFTERP